MCEIETEFSLVILDRMINHKEQKNNRLNQAEFVQKVTKTCCLVSAAYEMVSRLRVNGVKTMIMYQIF